MSSGPPLNPEKTASGIIVDPRTLERVIPSSRRKDGSVRKEQKVRAGFVPQEDMSAFRGRRQLEAEARRGVVPGSSGRVGLAGKTDNPFAQQHSEPSKTSTPSEQRKPKRVEYTPRPMRNWDSETDEEDEEEATRRAFAVLRVDTSDQKAFPPLGGKGSRSGSTSPVKPPSPKKPSSPKRSAWKTLPDPTPRAPPAPASAPAPAPAPAPATSVSEPEPASPAPSSTWVSTSGSDTPSWRSSRGRRGTPASPQWNAARPHPIQGGRKGPIGLAHPPPIEPRGRGRGRGDFARGGRGGHEAGQIHGHGHAQEPGHGAAETPQKERREREPVRVRDAGPLADRVRNLLLQNQASDRRRPAAGGEAGASAAGATSDKSVDMAEKS